MFSVELLLGDFSQLSFQIGDGVHLVNDMLKDPPITHDFVINCLS